VSEGLSCNEAQDERVERSRLRTSCIGTANVHDNVTLSCRSAYRERPCVSAGFLSAPASCPKQQSSQPFGFSPDCLFRRLGEDVQVIWSYANAQSKHLRHVMPQLLGGS
jgi:hypothetical protein